MKFLKLIVLALNALFYLKCATGASDVKVFKFDRAMQCPGYKNLTLIIEKFILFRIDKMYAFSIKFKVLKTTSNKLKMRMQLKRCKARESLDTCESIPDFVFSTVCMLISVKLPPFGAAFKAVHPPINCPIEKGSYIMDNHTIDALTLQVLPLEGWYWKINTYMYDTADNTEKLVTCVNTEFTVVMQHND